VAAAVIAFAILATSTVGQAVTSTLTETAATGSGTPTTTTLPPATSTTTISTLSSQPPCYPSGESGPVALSVRFDSNQSPVAGAQVRATNQPYTISCNGSPPYPVISQTTVSFTTDGHTLWYYLDGGYVAGYSIGVTYLGHDYDVTATLHPEYAYCLVLSLPSGKTNSTGTEFQSSCP